jgi:hypothetical protein
MALAKNFLFGLVLLVGAGFAAWLFLPMTNVPAQIPPAPTATLVVPIGPIQVNLMLVVFFIAAGTPFAAAVMGLVVRWLSRIVNVAASTPAAPAAPARKSPAAPAAATAAEAAVEQELPIAQKLVWLALILIAIGVMVFFVLQVLPPGFTLFQ